MGDASIDDWTSPETIAEEVVIANAAI